MIEHVNIADERQRFSWELRPDRQLDAQVRAVAARLESAGLIADGAATAPRFHPHLTLLRSRTVDRRALNAIAELLDDAPNVTLDAAAAFGGGRIIYLTPSAEDAQRMQDVRAALIALLSDEDIDPSSLARDPWTPHVTVAYAVESPEAQPLALERVRAELPLQGTWRVAQAWDLSIRPTIRAGEARIAGPRMPV
jgi:2'-5' RNA ligase